MDIPSHALWVGVGAAVAQRTKPIENRTVGAIVALAVLPDVIHLVRILSWAMFGDGTPAALYAPAASGSSPDAQAMLLVQAGPRAGQRLPFDELLNKRNEDPCFR